MNFPLARKSCKVNELQRRATNPFGNVRDHLAHCLFLTKERGLMHSMTTNSDKSGTAPATQHSKIFCGPTTWRSMTPSGRIVCAPRRWEGWPISGIFYMPMGCLMNGCLGVRKLSNQATARGEPARPHLALFIFFRLLRLLRNSSIRRHKAAGGGGSTATTTHLAPSHLRALAPWRLRVRITFTNQAPARRLRAPEQ